MSHDLTGGAPSAGTLDEPGTPFLALDPGKAEANIARLRGRLDALGAELRPHVKTVKSVDVARMLFNGRPGPITVSTLAEAEAFAEAGFTDILYAVGIAPDKLGRVIALRERGVDLVVLLDSLEQAAYVARAARTGETRIPALIEVDCDGHRGGVLPGDPAARQIAQALVDGGAGLRGVLTHAGESYFADGPVALAAAADNERRCALKIGSYWPGNADRGIPRHSSIVLLFDQTVGRLAATVEAGTVNAYRTAAADAVAVDALARADASTLTVFGTGHQALYECAAVSRVRPFDTIHVVARSAERGERFLAELSRRGLCVRLTTAREACLDADVIVTATTARSPLFDADWIRPGTHIASMGSDAHGKQELPPTLLKKARLFCDLPTQSVAIGEFQNIADLVADGTLRLDALGDVLTGKAEGRRTPEDITVFDSSGIALQDLSVATALLNAVPNAP